MAVVDDAGYLLVVCAALVAYGVLWLFTTGLKQVENALDFVIKVPVINTKITVKLGTYLFSWLVGVGEKGVNATSHVLAWAFNELINDLAIILALPILAAE